MKKILTTAVALCFSLGAFAADPAKVEPKTEATVTQAQPQTKEAKPDAPKAEQKKSVVKKAKKAKQAQPQVEQVK